MDKPEDSHHQSQNVTRTSKHPSELFEAPPPKVECFHLLRPRRRKSNLTRPWGEKQVLFASTLPSLPHIWAFSAYKWLVQEANCRRSQDLTTLYNKDLYFWGLQTGRKGHHCFWSFCDVCEGLEQGFVKKPFKSGLFPRHPKPCPHAGGVNCAAEAGRSAAGAGLGTGRGGCGAKRKDNWEKTRKNTLMNENYHIRSLSLIRFSS